MLIHHDTLIIPVYKMDALPQLGSRFTDLKQIGKGSYGVVYGAWDRLTGEPVALKYIKNVFRHPADAARVLREIKLLRLLRASDDLVQLKTVLLPDKNSFTDLVLVFELMEADLHEVIKLNHDLQPEHHQWFLFQMLRCLSFMHEANILHRDLKPRNILLTSDCNLKICDLGLARLATTNESCQAWTDYVATRWYRAPELCGSFFATYTPAVDVWSVGCVFAEMLLRRPLFAGKNVAHQLEIITDILGTPPLQTIAKIPNLKARNFIAAMPQKPGYNLRRVFPGADPKGLDLLKKLLAFDPDLRISAKDALCHPYFDSIREYQQHLSPVNISPNEFAFDHTVRMSEEDVKEMLYKEILEWHPRLHHQAVPIMRSATSPCILPAENDSFQQACLTIHGTSVFKHPSQGFQGMRISEPGLNLVQRKIS